MSKAKIIKIPISSVAHLVGFDNYNNFPKTVCELLRKYQKEKFEKVEKEMQKQDIELATDSDARKLVRHDKKHGTNIYQQVKIINNIKTTGQQLVSNQNTILKRTLTSTNISDEEGKNEEQVESMTNKSHGIKSGMMFLKLNKKAVCLLYLDKNGWFVHLFLIKMESNGRFTVNMMV